jgi:hypothetical protein
MVVKVVEAAHTGDKDMPSPSNVYSDFLDLKNDVTWDPSKLNWKLLHTATSTEYKLWEAAMECGFILCNLMPMDTMVSSLITMHVDWKVYMMWGANTRARGVSHGGWEDCRKFFLAKFLSQSEKEATTVILVQPVSVAMTKSSKEKKHDVVCAKSAVEKG